MVTVFYYSTYSPLTTARLLDLNKLFILLRKIRFIFSWGKTLYSDGAHNSNPNSQTVCMTTFDRRIVIPGYGSILIHKKQLWLVLGNPKKLKHELFQDFSKRNFLGLEKPFRWLLLCFWVVEMYPSYDTAEDVCIFYKVSTHRMRRFNPCMLLLNIPTCRDTFYKSTSTICSHKIFIASDIHFSPIRRYDKNMHFPIDVHIQ